jgi:hypothetical protein
MGQSTKYYQTHPEARKKKAATDKKINARTDQKAKRAELGRKRYADAKAGKAIKGKDFDHAVGKYVSPKVNRGRKGEGNR